MVASKAKAYYQALKPERTFFNVMTTAAGFLFACQWHIDIGLFGYTLLGTSLLVASACAANNYTDRNLDTRMPRTQNRATANGGVSPFKVLVLAVVLGLLGFAVLMIHVNTLTTVLGLIAYIDYVILYAWSKRHTPWSTLIGTPSGALPLIAGYTAVIGQINTTVLLLFSVMVFWQMVHFFAIAIFRQKDYAAGGIPVWAVRYGIRSTQRWMIAYTLLYTLSIATLSVYASLGWAFSVGMLSLAAFWLYRGLVGFKAQEPITWARSMFGLSLVILLAFSALIAIQPVLF